MTPAKSLSVNLFTRLEQRVSELEALPLAITVPFGLFSVNILYLRTILEMRNDLRFYESFLDASKFPSWPLADRKALAETFAAFVEDIRQGLSKAESVEFRRLYFRPLTHWSEKMMTGYSDLAETFALGADPELDSLAEELNDVL